MFWSVTYGLDCMDDVMVLIAFVNASEHYLYERIFSRMYSCFPSLNALTSVRYLRINSWLYGDFPVTVC